MARAHPTVDEVLELLEVAPQRIAGLTSGATGAQLAAAPEPGEWSVDDVLAHLRACADVWGGCIAAILAEDSPRIREMHPRRWITQTDYPELDAHASLKAFAAQRIALLSLLEPLTAEEWARGAMVTRGGKRTQRTVFSYAELLTSHERLHIKQIASVVKTFQPISCADGEDLE